MDISPSQSGSKVLVSDTWDGSVREIKVEMVDMPAQAQATASTPINESQYPADSVSTSSDGTLSRIAGPSSDGTLSRIAGQSIAELRSALRVHGDIQQRVLDPSAVEVLQADRLMAAANTKAVSLLPGLFWSYLTL